MCTCALATQKKADHLIRFGLNLAAIYLIATYDSLLQ